MFGAAVDEFPASQIVGVSLDIIRGRLGDGLLFLRQQLDLQLLDNGMGDFVLDGKDVGEIAIETFRPNVTAIVGANELAGDAHARSCFSHASFKYKTDPEFLSDLLHFYWFAFVGERGVTRDDEKTGDFG